MITKSKLNLTKTLNLGESHDDVNRLADYLQMAGYLPRDRQDAAMTLGTNLSRALSKYQAYRRIPITGILDDETLRDLNSIVRFDPEPDVPAGAKIGALGVSEGFVVTRTKWRIRRFRYSFTNITMDETVERQRAACRCALKLWSEVYLFILLK